MALFRANSTRKDLNDWLSQDPGKGPDNYSSQIGAALANAANRAPAAQRYNTAADPNIQASRTNYRLMAQAAAANAAQGTKDLSGGYDAAYADSAAAQGYQQIMEGQHNNEEALRQMALEGMAAGDNQADMLTAALLGAQQLETSANQMAQNRYQAQRDFLTNEAAQAQAEEDNFWSNVWNGLVWAADVAMKTYDNYKGYTQQEREWQAYLDQLKIENERYEREYADAVAAAEWEKMIKERELGLDEEYTKTQIEAMQQDMDLAAQAAAAGMYSGSGGGSGGGIQVDTLSPNELDTLLSGYRDAMLMGDTEAAAVYADAMGRYGYSIGRGIASDVDKARDQGLTFDGTIRYLQSLGYGDDEITRIMTQKQSYWR